MLSSNGGGTLLLHPSTELPQRMQLCKRAVFTLIGALSTSALEGRGGRLLMMSLSTSTGDGYMTPQGHTLKSVLQSRMGQGHTAIIKYTHGLAADKYHSI